MQFACEPQQKTARAVRAHVCAPVHKHCPAPREPAVDEVEALRKHREQRLRHVVVDGHDVVLELARVVKPGLRVRTPRVVGQRALRAAANVLVARSHAAALARTASPAPTVRMCETSYADSTL
jgi:hypothetical protein